MAIRLGEPRTILIDGDPRLATVSEVGARDDADFDDQVGDLAATLADFRAEHGFGRAISAPQIGWMRRVIVCELGSGPTALVDPEVFWRSEDTQVVWDDCLSVPGRLVRVERAHSISMRWTDEDGDRWEWHELPADMTELFLHEIDHLDGVLMLDHASGPGDVQPMDRRGELVDGSRPARTEDPMRAGRRPSASRWQSVDTASYDQQWATLDQPHGEADLVASYGPTRVLDAGCGTGRVAIELARRGHDVVGVDLDQPMIAAAQAKAPGLDFRVDDLATAELRGRFDAIVMAGNVMIFVAPGTEASVIQNMADHLDDGGRLIAGFQLDRALGASHYVELAEAAGLQLEEHWSTWERSPAHADDTYGVFVHRKTR